MNLNIAKGHIDELSFEALTPETIIYLRSALGITTTPPVDPPPPPPSGTFGTPAGLAVTNNVISWNAVPTAIKYKIRIKANEAIN
jgi:NADH:ubiquinone oxidoreductase subunit F (NADH-binding)